MNVATVMRQGFSHRRAGDPHELSSVLSYDIDGSFAAAWRRALNSGAQFALLIDDATPCSGRLVQLLTTILGASPTLDGLTADAWGLERVLGTPPATRRGSCLPWMAEPIPILPSWLALLRIASWQDAQVTETPEFFLLRGCPDRSVARTLAPRIELDCAAWSADLAGHAARRFADDYLQWKRKSGADAVPHQFRVEQPGRDSTTRDWTPTGSAPLFSVLCPSIRVDFLVEAVESVRSQTYRHWELRIGVDGPKESQRKKIVEALAPYAADPRIHIRFHENLGTGPTRQRLAESARGDYLIPMDDDDRLPPGALARFARAVEESAGAPILRGGVRLFGLLETYLPPRPRYTVSGIPNDLFEVNQPYAVRRDVFESLGGFEWDPDLKNAGEDSDLLLKADHQGLPIVLIDEPLYERRLSTLNQTLDCTAEECRTHVFNLYARHSPAGWSLEDVRFAEAGPLVRMTTHHRRADTRDEVVCSTTFMNFQQVGSRAGVVLDLEVTSLCNAVCTFCPREHLERTAKFIELEKVEKLADSLRKEPDRHTVVLCGIGESTLHPELESIIEILAPAQCTVCMTTNGSNLTWEWVQKLVAAGLSELNVSLNATTAETHAKLMGFRKFKQVAAICNRIADECERGATNLEFHVSLVLTEANEHEIDEFIDTWDRGGVAQIWLHPLTNRSGLLARNVLPGDIESVARKYARHERVTVDLFRERDGPNNLCRVAQGVDFISVEGEMLLCAQDYKARHRFGNIGDAGLDRLHENKVLRHLRGETASVCSSCTFCPPSFRAGHDPSYTIVQAGAD